MAACSEARFFASGVRAVYCPSLLVYHLLFNNSPPLSFNLSSLVQSLGAVPEKLEIGDSGLMLVRVKNSTENAIVLRLQVEQAGASEGKLQEVRVFNSSLGDN